MKLKVVWIPQVPMKGFYWPVESLVEAKKVMNLLAEYDLFQFENNVKGDYSNAGDLLVFDENDTEDSPEGSWVTWYNDDGYCIYDLTMEELQALETAQ